MVVTIGTHMLKRVRDFIIYHKAIFGAAIIAFAAILTEPEEYKYLNTPVLLRIRDKFLQYLIFRVGLYKAAFKIALIALERPLYVASRVSIFRGALILFASALPDPYDTSNFECQYANTPLLQAILDDALQHSGLDTELQLAIKKIVICEMEHDPDHRAVWEFIFEECTEAYVNGELVFSNSEPGFITAFEIILSSVTKAIMAGKWQPREVGWPGGRMWREPRTQNEGNYGGFRGYKFKQKINK